MKAAIRKKYGPPETLLIKDIDQPTVQPNEVLIKVAATTVNRTDTAVLTGKPFVMRFFTGLFTPTLPIPGTDFAGTVEAVGRQVTQFKVNDRVFGFKDEGLGSQAEYMCYSEKKNITKNRAMTEGSYRVLRGGSWHFNATNSRVSNRSYYIPVNRYYTDGFRIAHSQ